MPAEYIHDTKMGRADFIDRSSSGDLCIYSWDAADGCTILRVVVYKGTVNEVTKRNDIHWSGDNWKNVDHKSYSKPSYSYNSDPYNAGSYSNADDFYYDYYDDFFDYEDAEYYWNSHN